MHHAPMRESNTDGCGGAIDITDHRDAIPHWTSRPEGPFGPNDLDGEGHHLSIHRGENRIPIHPQSCLAQCLELRDEFGRCFLGCRGSAQVVQHSPRGPSSSVRNLAFSVSRASIRAVSRSISGSTSVPWHHLPPRESDRLLNLHAELRVDALHPLEGDHITR